LLMTIPFVLMHYLLELNLLNFSNLIIYGVLFTVLYIYVIGLNNKTFVKMLFIKFKNGNNK
jgi:hypothetical protein